MSKKVLKAKTAELVRAFTAVERVKSIDGSIACRAWDDTLTLLSGTGEEVIRATCSLKQGARLAFHLPYGKVLPALEVLGGEIDIELVDDYVYLVSGKTRLKIKQFVGSYPAEIVVPDESIQISGADLYTAINSVIFAADFQASAATYGAVQLVISNGSITTAATDRLMAALYSSTCADGELSVLLPSKTIRKHLPFIRESSYANLSAGNDRITIALDDRSVVVIPCLEGKFPDVSGLFGSLSPNKSVTFSADSLDAAMKIARVCSSETAIRVIQSGGVTTVSSVADETGEAKTVVDATDIGGFSAKYDQSILSDALSRVRGGQVTLSFNEPDKATLVTCPSRPLWKFVFAPMYDKG